MLTILMGCMKVRGALETLVSALSPIEHAKSSKNEVQPQLMNSDLLSREVDSISLLLSLLVGLLPDLLEVIELLSCVYQFLI